MPSNRPDHSPRCHEHGRDPGVDPFEPGLLPVGEKGYRLLFEHMDSTVCTLDLQGRFTSVNRAGERLTGYRADELVGKLAVELIAPELREGAVRRFQRRLTADAEAAADESVLVTRDGKRIPIEITSRLLSRDGRPFGVLGLVRDVTERKSVEEALLESERRFRSAFDFAAIGMALVAPDGRWLEVNDSLCEIVGYSADELLGMTFQDITHPDDLEADLELVRQMLTGEIRTYQLEKRYFHKMSRIVWILLSVSLVRSSDGSPLYFVSQIEDITEQKRAEETITRSEARLAEAQQVAHIGSWEWNPAASDVATWSDELYRIFGFDPGSPELTYRRFLETVHAEDRQMVEEVTTKAYKAGESFATEYRIVAPDGTVRWIHGRGDVVKEDDGSVTLRATAQDITEQKEAEEERDRLRDELHHAQKLEALGRLAGGVAHDFNNMLTAIKGYSELLLDTLESGSPALKEAEQIRRASEQAAALPRQLLAFSRKQVLQPRLVDLDEVILAASDLLRQLVGETIDVARAPGTSSAQVLADPSQLEQALVNLVLNARDAMPGGGTITISTGRTRIAQHEAVEQEVTPGDYAVISVSDTGHGMDPETKARIFEPFFTTKQPGQGSGLGLSTVYGLVRQSRGFMRVESETGRGSTFEMHFPCVDAEIERDPTSHEMDVQPASSATVVLVEDEEFVRDLAATALDRAGYRVLAAASAAEALVLCEQPDAAVDVLVSDMVMPGMGGRELAERVLAGRPETAVVLMSGYPDEAPVIDRADGSAPSFLEKPFSPHQLVHAVGAALEQTSLGGNGSHPREVAQDGSVDTSEAITCLVADDHPAVLDAVSRFLEGHGIEVVARVSRGDDALNEIESLRPSIALLDVGMEPVGGIEVARRAAEASPESRVVLYTGQRDSALLEKALDAGARGFVLKEAPLSELVRALGVVASGGTYVDPELSGAFVSAQAVESLSPLTPREREVLGLLAEGMTNEKAGSALGISAETVQSHVRNAMGKLEADTRTQAVATAIRQSFIT